MADASESPLAQIQKAERTLRVLVGLDPLAEPLAHLLHQAAMDEWAHGPHCLEPCGDCDDDARAPYVLRALAVAHVVNREARP